LGRREADVPADPGPPRRALLAWLVEEARRRGSGRVDLDSGMERERAHAFYRRNGMRVTSLHFVIDVPAGAAR
jgi:hypothetical protein